MVLNWELREICFDMQKEGITVTVDSLRQRLRDEIDPDDGQSDYEFFSERFGGDESLEGTIDQVVSEFNSTFKPIQIGQKNG